MKVETKMVSPDMAEALLETNPNNRNVAYSRVQTLVAAMRNGKWQLNGETIIIGESGRLLDGQHRLYAVREFGKPVEMIIASGVSDKSFETIDTGRARTAVDIAKLAGREMLGVEAAACANIWRLWHQTSVSTVCSPHIVLQVDTKFPAIHKWGKFVIAAAQKRVAPAGALLTALVYLEDVARKPLAAERFFKGIVKGVSLPEGDPLLTLRNRLITLRGESSALRMETVWNMFARTLTALEAGEQLYKVYADRHAGMIARPKDWEEHVKALPKSMSLDYLFPATAKGTNSRDLFNEMVNEHREKARDNVAQKKQA